MTHPTSLLRDFARDSGRTWEALVDAQAHAEEAFEAILAGLQPEAPFSNLDADLVVFGSIGRGEYLPGSDVDWTLLIDGQADEIHREWVNRVSTVLKRVKVRGEALGRPGPTGLFGKLEFSHPLVHNIGGQDDTNHNTTQRILLLLESRAIRHAGAVAAAHGRVVRAILKRYSKDTSQATAGENLIPRFLLNDIVRFWRTLCVDFGWKSRERDGAKWGLRNIKLRMSRKMTFVGGLLTVFSCYKNDAMTSVHDELVRCSTLTPIDLLIQEFRRAGLERRAAEILDIYDRYLRKLCEGRNRQDLEEIRSPEAAYGSSVFLEFRSISHEFHEALVESFLVDDSPLREFSLQYGVF